MPKDTFRREVALRLKGARRDHTLTQRQLADLGLSTQQNISRYEKGFIPDSWFLLARLHSEKAIDLNWLLGESAISADAQGGNGTGVPGQDLSGESIEPASLVGPAVAATPALELVGSRASAAPPPEPGVIAEDLERGGQL